MEVFKVKLQVLRLSLSFRSVASSKTVRNKVVYFVSFFIKLLAIFNRVFGFLFEFLSNLYTELSIVAQLIFGKRVFSSVKSFLFFVIVFRIKKEVRFLWITRIGEGWILKKFLQVILHVKYNNSLSTELLPTLDP